MEILSNKINKSDGRRRWWRIFQEGKKAFYGGVWKHQDPYQYNNDKKDSQEWKAGWQEGSQEFWDYHEKN